LTVSGRRLIDHRGRTFLVNGDAAWSLIVGPDLAGVRRYLGNRRAHGFNAIVVNLVEHRFDSNGAPKNALGQAPFSRAGDFSTPNPAYFAHATAVVREALRDDIEVFLFPAYLGFQGGDEGWYADIMRTGPAKMRAYGRYVGSLFRKLPNVVWVMGGDYAPNAARDEIQALVQGIQQTSSSQPLFTVHNARYQSGISQYPNETWIDLNTTYSDCDNAPAALFADYSAAPMPFFFIEGKYENETASTVCLRSQAYWSVLEGSMGEVFGNNPIWSFTTGWQSALDSTGARSMTLFARLFRSRASGTLVPDFSHSVLTGGYGDIGSSSYAAAARTAKGKSVIVYTPSPRSLTIDMTKLAGSRAKAWWFNPVSGRPTLVGAFKTAGSRSFTPPGRGDWVLVLDNASLGLAAPGR